MICSNTNILQNICMVLTGKDLMFHSTALFSGTHLAWPVVVLNLGESASLGTGTKMETLLAVERLLNWLRAWGTDGGTMAQLRIPSKTSKAHFQKVKFQYGKGNRTKHVYVRIWQVFGHSSGKLWAIPQDRSLKANYWNQGVCWRRQSKNPWSV